MSDDEVVAHFRTLWPEILGDLRHRHAERRMVVGLSGGLDSRAIAAGAVGMGWRPVTYTYGSERNDETRTAIKVAERLELAHMRIPVTDERLLPHARRIAEVLDGAHSPGEMYELWFDDVLRSVGDVVVNGLISGPLWGDDKTMGMTEHDAISAHLRARFSGEVAGVRPFLIDGLREGLPDAIANGIEDSLSGWDLSARADMTLFWKQANKLLRWGSMLTSSLRRSGMRLEAPFLDRRFLQLAARLTPQQRLNGRLYLRVHREVFTATAAIERSDDGNSPNMLNHVYWSGERSFMAQMASLTAHHPVAGLRRGSRRALRVGTAALRDHTLVAAPANRLDERSSVFPAELWTHTRSTYAERLADFLTPGGASSAVLDHQSMLVAADNLRSGVYAGSPAVLARVGAAAHWLDDYAARRAATRDLVPTTV